MPLEIYLRGKVWYVRGRIEFNGQPVTDYYRESTGSSSEAGARQWCAAEEERQIRRHLLGEEASLTFADAVVLYPAKPKEATFLMPIVAEIGGMFLSEITGKFLKQLAPKLYPMASSDTWWRQVVSPARSVINYAHEMGKCAPIKIRSYSEIERIDQDRKRGKLSRVPRKPFTSEWLEAFCAHADPYSAAMARFIFETGVRIDQAVSLTAQDLDLMNHSVRIKAQKGHPEQWIKISTAMVVDLANLPLKRPKNRKTGEVGSPRVFGYGSRGGYRKRWATICKNAGIDALTAHSGRHGFYTELRVRHGEDPITAAKMGRWKNPALPDARYAHVEADEGAIRELFRTKPVQGDEARTGNTMKSKRK